MRNSHGGGIGLEPVYAADVPLDVNNGKITAGSVSGTVNGTVGGEAIVDGTITNGSLTGGTFTGTVTLKGADIKTVIDGVDISKAKVTDTSSGIGTIGGLASDVNTNKGAITALNTAVGSTSAPGTLAYNTQKITYDGATGTTVEGKFTVKGTNAETVVSGAGGTTTIYGGGITISKAASSEYVSISEGSILATDSIKANKIISAGLETRMADGKVVAKNGLYIGYDGSDSSQATYDNSRFAVKGSDGSFKAAGGKFGVDKDGNVTTQGALKGKTLGIGTDNDKFTVAENGNTTVGGDLTVDGTATFAKETTFGQGIKTDTISEKTDGKGVTVDSVLLKDGGITATGDVTTQGALKGQTLGIGTGNDKFTVDKDGAVKAAGGKVEIDKTGKATFGDDANNRTTIAGKVATFGENDSITDHTTINGGDLDTYNLTVRNDMTVKNFKADNITSTNRITVGADANEVYLAANGTLSLGVEENQKLERTQLANINNTIKANRVIDATSATIGGVEINGGDVTTATGTITGKTITDGNGFTATGGKITANEGKIGYVEISAAGVVTGVSEIKANTFKVDEGNYLDSSGIKANSITAKGGTIGVAVINETTLAVGNTKLDSAEGITTNKLTIGDMTLTGTGLNTGTNDFQVNGVTFNQGKVTAKASEGFAAGNSSFKEGSLIVDDNNKLEATNGLTTEKATVTGTLDVIGQATFGAAGNQTTINGQTVTTDTLKANKLILGASGNTTVVVDKDGSLKAAGGKFEVNKDGALKAANGAFNVDKDGKTTFKKDDNNLSSINGGNIWAKATDDAAHTSSELTHTYKGLHVSGTQAGKTSAFDFDAATGISTFTGQNSTTTKINGSAITSTKATGDTGVLNGSSLTLDDGTNSTVMNAGGATFTGAAGEKGGTTTTINGGMITTDTLNVERINLGGEVIDKGAAGVEASSKLYMDAQGNFRAAGGNFYVKGADGAMTNTVGNTTLQTDNAGASMKFDNTAETGGVESKVTVEANKATVAAGDKASFVATTNDGGTATITGGTQTVTTTGDGTVFANSAHKNAFVTGGATTTIINGNEITTGKITTDQLVIKGNGSGDADKTGKGSIAFGGDGTIRSDINDGNGKNTSFETTLDGVNTKVTDGTTTTENQVTAAGNSNTVKQDDTHKSEFNQGLTSIGGVVTNGTINVAQNLDGEHGLLTNEVKDANGSSMLVQNGSGLEYTDSAKDKNATRINSSDVSIGSATNDKDRINLSDLGQIDNLDDELKNRPEYKNGEEVGTAVGAINAEAGIRREEVARLDNRIDDVNDRVNKVGAMAAAIASLKSIGYDPQAPSEFSIGLGQYKGETGVAMGFFHYPNKNFMINVSLSTAGGETMGGIGATWRFGHKSPQKLLEEQREAQAKKELAAAEKYQAAAKLAKEAQERAEYAAKLARQAQVSADNAKAAADATQAKHFG